MTSDFAFLTPGFFTRAEIWPDSLGTFRYRFQRTGWIGSPDAQIQAWVYENISFELAEQIETQTFPWTEEGVDALRQWLREKLAQRGAQPYRIPYPSRDASDIPTPAGSDTSNPAASDASNSGASDIPTPAGNESAAADSDSVTSVP